MDETAVRRQAACWACGTTVMLPCQNGMYAETYKCGWCGAITSPQKQPQKISFLSRWASCIFLELWRHSWYSLPNALPVCAGWLKE